MNLTPEKLSENIVHYMWNELGILSGLGNLKFNMSGEDKSNKLKEWKEEIRKMIKGADSQRKFLGFFDGSARPNPGIMTIGGYINDPSGKTIYSYSVNLGEGTNNVAEYNSLKHLLQECKLRGIKRIHIRGDSQLVINQSTGIWKCKDPLMKELCEEIRGLIKYVPGCTLEWSPRAKNKQADKLAEMGHKL